MCTAIRFRRPFMSLAVMLSGVLLSAPCLFADDQPVATVKQITGDVMIRHEENWVTVKTVPASLFNGDKISTEQGRAEIYFIDDGSVLTLDVGTNITVRAPEKQAGGGLLRRIEIYMGDVWFDMKKNLAQKTDLVTPTAVGGLRGTQGLVQVENSEHSEFTLKEGELEIVNRPRAGSTDRPQSVRLHAGETLTARHGEVLQARKAVGILFKPDVKTPKEKLPAPKSDGLEKMDEKERAPNAAKNTASEHASSSTRSPETKKASKPKASKSRPKPHHP